MLIRTKAVLLGWTSAVAVVVLLATCGVAGFQLLTLNDRLNSVSQTITDLRLADELAAEAISFPGPRVIYQWGIKRDDLSQKLDSLFREMNTPAGMQSEILGRLESIDRTVERLGAVSEADNPEVRRALTSRVNANRNALYDAVEGIQQQLTAERQSLVITTVSVLVAGIVLAGLALLSASFALQHTVQATLDDVGEAISRIRPDNRSTPITTNRQDEVGEFIERLEEIRIEVVEAFAKEQEARKYSEQLNNAKTAFVTTTSHELRTPLNGLMGSLTFMEQTKMSPEQKRYLNMAKTSGDSLLSIINNVLDISKIETGKLELENIPFNPTMLVDEVYSSFVPLAQRKGLALDVEYKIGQDMALSGDPNRIKQILTNMIGNAIKFTKHGGITMVVAAREGDDPDVANLEISVKDSGPGIPSDKLHSIFHSFQQADTSTTRIYGGTGLGLTISRHLATAMGGEISVKSEEGLGSVFTLQLNLPTTTLSTPARTFRTSQGTGEKKLSGVRVMCVDDVEINRIITAEMLRSWGCTVVLAENGLEAVERAAEQKFDMILMDIQMPILDGVDATRRIRSEGHPVPVVGLTANAFEEQRNYYLDAGMSDVVSKPVNWDRLYTVMASMVGVLEPDAAPVAEPDNEVSARSAINAAALESLVPIMPIERIKSVGQSALDEVAKSAREISDTDDMERISRTAHTMKGMCANIGFAGLADIFKTIESQTSVDGLPSFLDRISEARKATDLEFLEWIDSKSEGERPSDTFVPVSGTAH